MRLDSLEAALGRAWSDLDRICSCMTPMTAREPDVRVRGRSEAVVSDANSRDSTVCTRLALWPRNAKFVTLALCYAYMAAYESTCVSLVGPSDVLCAGWRVLKVKNFFYDLGTLDTLYYQTPNQDHDAV